MNKRFVANQHWNILGFYFAKSLFSFMFLLFSVYYSMIFSWLFFSLLFAEIQSLSQMLLKP